LTVDAPAARPARPHRRAPAVREQVLTDKGGEGFLLRESTWPDLLVLELYKGECVGRLQARLNPPAEMVLGNVVVFDLPDNWWGSLMRFLFPQKRSYRRRGLGTLLLQRAVACAQEMGLHQIHGSIVKHGLASNPRILEWYRQNGFTVQEPTSAEIRGAFARVYMDLRT